MVTKPDWIFDRVSEWNALTDFAPVALITDQSLVLVRAQRFPG